MKPTSWNSIPRVLFRFAPMGNLDKTSFKRKWTTFVNPAFCAAGKIPPKMVVWNRPRGIRSQGCFSVSLLWEKSKKRVLNAIGRPSSTRLFALLGKAYPKWWCQTDLVEFDPKCVFSFRPYGETRKNEFSTQLDVFRQPGVFRSLVKPSQNGGMITNSLNSIQGCFFVLPRWGKSKKRVLKAIRRPSSTRLFPLLGKAHPKWSYETDLVEFDPKGVFSFRPDWESRKNEFWTQLDDFRQPGFFRCFQKLSQNGGMKPTSWNSVQRVFFPFATMGKVEKTCFEHYWRDFVNLAFCTACKSPTKIVIWNRPRGILIPRVFFRFPPMGKVELTSFERNRTTFVNPAFFDAWESPPKMVVWNQNW